MRRARVAVVVTAAVTMLLTGCVSTSSYPSADDAIIENERQRLLDATWMTMGAPTIGRPSPEVLVVSGDDNWDKHLFACASEVVPGDFGYSFGAQSGYDFQVVDRYDQRTLVALYACLAELPLQTQALLAMRSPQQLEFLYSYYREWFVPCATAIGLEIEWAPTREQFLASGGYWGPYSALNLISADDWRLYERAIERCGEDPALTFDS